MPEVFADFWNNSESGQSQTTLPIPSFTTAEKLSPPQGCIEVIFSANQSVPSENPDALVSARVESITSYIKNVVFIFLFLIGGPGNVINMAVFYKQGLKDRVNLCLFALALADELYLITVVIYNGEQLFLQFTSGAKLGPVRIALTNNHFVGLMGFDYVSYILSVVIASERCHCVLRPLTYHNLMQTRTMAAIIAGIYVLMSSLYFVAMGFQYSYGCIYDRVTGVVRTVPMLGTVYLANKQFMDVLHSIMFGIVFPVLVIVEVSVTTSITAVKLRQIVTWRAETSVSISAREVALTKMLIANSVLFIVCVVPTALARNVSLMFPEVNVGRRNHNLFLTVVWLSQIFTYVNCSANIFVYYAMGSRYRDTFRSLLGKRMKPREKK